MSDFKDDPLDDLALRKRGKKKKKEEQKRELSHEEEIAAHLDEQTKEYMTLARAAFTGNTKALERHIKEGAKLDVSLAETGLTPLVTAIQGNYFQAARLLVEEGHADANLPSSQGGITPLMAAAGLSDTVDILEWLLNDRGCNVDAQDHAGCTALFYAARAGNLRGAEMLILKNANVDHQNRRDVTPLMVAATESHIPVIDLLIRHGADLTRSDYNSNNVLHYAAMCGHPKSVQLIGVYSQNKLVGMQNRHGKTPGDLAADTATVNALLALASSDQ